MQKFEKMRLAVKALLIGGLVLCVASLLIGSSNSVMAGWLTAVALICIGLCCLFVFTGMRCPYCGRRIIKNCLVVKSCPHCRRNLATGLKNKKSK